jgi:hypothetical protein
MNDKQSLHSGYNQVWQYAVGRLGYEIFEGSDHQDACWSDVKQITICSRMGIEKKLYALLHECGHALIRENWSKFAKEYAAHAEVPQDGRRQRNTKYKVSTIEEEIEAWKRGKRLAKRLDIELDEERYDEHKTECLMSYIRWAA